ncbi:hypothetical protein PN36_05170 [Candidatus Thiomargarita nelsonii]|uniref:Uncharacterized protein n=1 Tax=Candidatus Thiomargarita nelsonii TaxID=1003181 RepID=A0A4E0RTX7_9GAMM|nr:hypothetical protein PN36_05170 [Candidatus Thiomargarita nelsonii]
MSEKKKPLLHEILAIEQEYKANAERARNQSIETFRSKQKHFTGMRRTFRPFAVDEQMGDEGGERLEAETRLVKTVAEELEQMLKSVSEAVDLGYQIDQANTRAKADIVIDDDVIAKDVPATFLLQLEKRLREIRAVLKEIPCFDPVRLWSLDPGADKKYVLRAEPVTTIRKQRTKKYNVMYEATKEHPAQVDIVEIEEPIGEIRSYEWTGMLSPGSKTAILEQLEKLLSAVKTARSRANIVVVDNEKKIARKLFNYLLKPIND